MATEDPPTAPDLAEAVGALGRRLLSLEEPILRSAGVSMWEYAILTTLLRGGAVSQVELSRRTGRDTTRLGKNLAELESRGLITREQADDARRRTVAATADGAAAQRHAKQEIRAAEDRLLAAHLSNEEAATLRRLLERLLPE
ncbi:MarR family winged helix-turn-helix transcriptional regulator [Tsukamurella paurometabola]|uniref:Homoprotocatechuate degradation operon regulator, HpaR n=1 Tax=Tsukamurella paurometabola TaxID=2061 RepID=A0A3P8MCZ4_TSUPA|nr:helix-turn-helix domain-containing protein [Tsukamurella paurometabola]MBS4100362.1 MarR family transcriptional regulator [Tsukamurella paurometabola]UEA82717.1 MarR family transcriptional regulator [Tsukamurella paurometabola]VDR39786.1 homoprotocatechuate degradation operon regulator, HpaR [Tsukamurella paurometabola]